MASSLPKTILAWYATGVGISVLIDMPFSIWQSQQPGYQGRLKSRLLFDAANALCWHVTIPVGVAMFVDGHVRGNKWQWKVAVYKNQEKLD